MSQNLEDYPNSVTVKFQFSNQDYINFKKLAQDLEISVEQLIADFFQEGVSMMWEAFEYKARKKQ